MCSHARCSVWGTLASASQERAPKGQVFRVHHGAARALESRAPAAEHTCTDSQSPESCPPWSNLLVAACPEKGSTAGFSTSQFHRPKAQLQPLSSGWLLLNSAECFYISVPQDFGTGETGGSLQPGCLPIAVHTSKICHSP